MALFLVVGALAMGGLVQGSSETGGGVFGGPTSFVSWPQGSEPTLDAEAYRAGAVGASSGGEVLLADAALAAEGSSSGGAGSLLSYVVERGDTVSEVADTFGISPQTVLWANPGIRSGALRAGETLVILPVSGILYSVREGETPESIASSFGLTLGQLSGFNRGIDLADISMGTTLVIPGGKPEDISRMVTPSKKLPRIPGYFTMPTKGFNWGRLHGYNAVDIANSCGTEVDAAAEGLVVPDDSLGDGSSGWNDGYGKFVLLEHPNGTKTRYAHLESVSVTIGDYLREGAALGTMGNTGNVHGPTGCHLHFEIYGAENPFVK